MVANEWKDANDKVMPVKQWLEERRFLQVILFCFTLLLVELLLLSFPSSIFLFDINFPVIVATLIQFLLNIELHSYRGKCSNFATNLL